MPDYLALAKQFGGSMNEDDDPQEDPTSEDVDYLALAKQFGGEIETTPSAAPVGGSASASVRASGAVDATTREDKAERAMGVLSPLQRLGIRASQGMGQMPGAADLGIGAAKKAGNTVTNLGEMILDTPVIGTAAKLSLRPFGLGKPEQISAARTALEPSNTMQRVGGAAEQVAEVLAPGRLIAKTAGAGAARLAQMGIRPAASNLIARSATEGGAGALLAKLQGGDSTTGGIIGAAGPVVGAMAKSVAPALRASAEKGVMQALGPTKERFKAMAEKVTPGILARGLRGSREVMKANASAEAEAAGRGVASVLGRAADQVVDVRPVVEALETAKASHQSVKEFSLGDAIAKKLVVVGDKGKAMPAPGVTIRPDGTVQHAVALNERAVQQLTSLQNTLQELGDSVTVAQLVGVRRAWDKVVDQAGGFAHRAKGAIGMPLADQTEAAAKREATTAIRRLLDEEVPDLTAINKEFSFWKSLDDVLGQTLKRAEPQGKGLTRTIASGAGHAAGASMGFATAGLPGGMVGSLAVGQVTDKLAALLTSPRWRLASAQTKDRLAEALASGNAEKVSGFIGRLTGTQGAKLVPSHRQTGSLPTGPMPRARR